VGNLHRVRPRQRQQRRQRQRQQRRQQQQRQRLRRVALGGSSTRDAEPATGTVPLPSDLLPPPIPVREGTVKKKSPLSHPVCLSLEPIHGTARILARRTQKCYNSSLLFIRLICDCRKVLYRALVTSCCARVTLRQPMAKNHWFPRVDVAGLHQFSFMLRQQQRCSI
jgi:hypothetical protein